MATYEYSYSIDLKIAIKEDKDTKIQTVSCSNKKASDKLYLADDIYFDLKLKSLSFDKHVYDPYSIQATIEASLYGDKAGTKSFDIQKSIPFQQFYQMLIGGQVEFHRTSREGYKETTQCIAKNCFIFRATPKLTPNNKSSIDIDLDIYSADKFLDTTKHSRTYVARKLKEEILAELVHMPEAVGKPAITIDEGAKMQYMYLKKKGSSEEIEVIQPYLVQYNETAYSMLRRTANRCGEFLYFENGNICLGINKSNKKNAGNMSFNSVSFPMGYGDCFDEQTSYFGYNYLAADKDLDPFRDSGKQKTTDYTQFKMKQDSTDYKQFKEDLTELKAADGFKKNKKFVELADKIIEGNDKKDLTTRTALENMRDKAASCYLQHKTRCENDQTLLKEVIPARKAELPKFYRKEGTGDYEQSRIAYDENQKDPKTLSTVLAYVNNAGVRTAVYSDEVIDKHKIDLKIEWQKTCMDIANAINEICTKGPGLKEAIADGEKKCLEDETLSEMSKELSRLMQLDQDINDGKHVFFNADGTFRNETLQVGGQRRDAVVNFTEVLGNYIDYAFGIEKDDNVKTKAASLIVDDVANALKKASKTVTASIQEDYNAKWKATTEAVEKHNKFRTEIGNIENNIDSNVSKWSSSKYTTDKDKWKVLVFAYSYDSGKEEYTALSEADHNAAVNALQKEIYNASCDSATYTQLKQYLQQFEKDAQAGKNKMTMKLYNDQKAVVDRLLKVCDAQLQLQEQKSKKPFVFDLETTNPENIAESTMTLENLISLSIGGIGLIGFIQAFAGRKGASNKTLFAFKSIMSFAYSLLGSTDPLATWFLKYMESQTEAVVVGSGKSGAIMNVRTNQFFDNYKLNGSEDFVQKTKDDNNLFASEVGGIKQVRTFFSQNQNLVSPLQNFDKDKLKLLDNAYYELILRMEKDVEKQKIVFDLNLSKDNTMLFLGDTVEYGDKNYVVTAVKGGFTSNTDDGNFYETVEAIPLMEADTLYIPPLSSHGHVLYSQPQIGYVTANNDPDFRARVRVRYQWENSGAEASPWINISAMMATDNGRAFFLPRVGDHVILNYEKGNIERPYVAGSLFHDTVKPLYGESQVLKAPSGARISLEDGSLLKNFFSFIDSPIITAAMAPMINAWEIDTIPEKNWGGGGIVMTDDMGLFKIACDAAQRNITISSPLGDVMLNAFTGITINAPHGDINIKGKNVNIEARNSVNITSGLGAKQAIDEAAKSPNDKWQDAGKAMLTQFAKNAFSIDLSLFRCIMERFNEPVNSSVNINSQNNVYIKSGKGANIAEGAVSSTVVNEFAKTINDICIDIIFVLSQCVNKYTELWEETNKLQADIDAMMSALYNVYIQKYNYQEMPENYKLKLEAKNDEPAFKKALYDVGDAGKDTMTAFLSKIAFNANDICADATTKVTASFAVKPIKATIAEEKGVGGISKDDFSLPALRILDVNVPEASAELKVDGKKLSLDTVNAVLLKEMNNDLEVFKSQMKECLEKIAQFKKHKKIGDLYSAYDARNDNNNPFKIISRQVYSNNGRLVAQLFDDLTKEITFISVNQNTLDYQAPLNAGNAKSYLKQIISYVLNDNDVKALPNPILPCDEGKAVMVFDTKEGKKYNDSMNEDAYETAYSDNMDWNTWCHCWKFNSAPAAGGWKNLLKDVGKKMIDADNAVAIKDAIVQKGRRLRQQGQVIISGDPAAALIATDTSWRAEKQGTADALQKVARNFLE